MKTLCSVSSTVYVGVLTHGYNPSNQKVEEGGSKAQGHPLEITYILCQYVSAFWMFPINKVIESNLDKVTELMDEKQTAQVTGIFLDLSRIRTSQWS